MQLEYYDSKARLVLILLGGVALTGIGIWMFIANPDPGSGLMRLLTMDGKLTRFYGAFAAIFFAACSVRGVQLLLDKSPRIVLSDRGVLDRTLCKDTIAWSDIQDVQLGEMMNQKFICLFLKEPDKYHSQLTGPMKLSAGGNKSMVGTAYTMNLSALKADPEAICREIRSRIDTQ